MKCLLLKVASYLCFSFLFLCMGLFISSGHNIKDLNSEITNKIHVEIQGFAFRIFNRVRLFNLISDYIRWIYTRNENQKIDPLPKKIEL